MSTVTLTAENFEQFVEKPGVLVIDWWASWCGPCKAFAPIYEKASEKYSDVVFGKINTDEQAELAGSFQIQAIPTLMVFRDQVLVFARPGMIPGAALDELVDKVKALDMDEVRRHIAESEAHDHQHAEGHDHDHDHDHHDHDHDHGEHGHVHDGPMVDGLEDKPAKG